MTCKSCGRSTPALFAGDVCDLCRTKPKPKEKLIPKKSTPKPVEKHVIKRRARRNPNVISEPPSPPSWVPDLTKLDPLLIDELRDHQEKAREFIAEQETGERIF